MRRAVWTLRSGHDSHRALTISLKTFIGSGFAVGPPGACRVGAESRG